MEEEYREITIKLWGTPEAKQSARFYSKVSKKTGKASTFSYTDASKKKKQNDYIKQIKAQLPSDFKMFTKEVIITESLMVYPPLSSMSKKKIKAISEGEIVPKTTRPDLIDNLHKMPLDCMSGLVYKDDALIWKSEGIMQKVYGIEGYTQITMKGK